MSSRQRRLLEKDVLAVPVEEDEQSGESEEDVSQIAVTSTNPYELLEGMGDDSASEKEEEAPEAAVESGEHAGDVNSGKSKKKRKKKKKQKQDDEVDRILSDINRGDVEVETSTTSKAEQGSSKEASNVFVVSLKSLRGDEELHKMFGAKVVASVEAELEQKRRQEAGRRGQSSSRHGNRRFIRRFILTDPQPEWNAQESGLSMISKGRMQNGAFFEYVPSEAYEAVHEQFLQCQDLGDPNALSAFIRQHPFHVESLLAMHDLLITTGSHLHAEECLNRALFALEAAWHRSFAPLSGNCRLEFKVELNKLFFTAVFSHVQHLSRRGCLKTAFESCKLLLSLDVSDPLGALCMIDYLAIRAGQFGFVEDLIEQLSDGPALAVRPGIAYSLALCRYKSDKRESSIERLIQAVLMHPLVVHRLMGKLKHSGVRTSHEWDPILQHNVFAKATDNGNASLNHLVNLFVERHYVLYKPQDVQDWLLEGCQRAVDCVTQGLSNQGVTAEDWACVRRTAFPPNDRNHFSHLHLYNFSDEVDRLPEDVLRGHGGGDDAWAELERRMAEELEQHGGVAGVVQLREEDLRNANPLVVFLRSLLPWVQTEQQNNQNQQDRNEER